MSGVVGEGNQEESQRGSADQTPLAVGSVLAGYEIEGVAGRGGMGVVYVATQLRPRRTVALKVVAPEVASDPEFRARFERESEIAASIEHPNVIPVYEVNEESGHLFIAMRYVAGTDLRQVVHGEGRLTPAHAADLVAQVAGGLDAAHAAGLVHRDVKPANVLVSKQGDAEHVYLTDFGLTKRSGGESGLTRTGVVVGTIDYMAPEQLSGDRVDARADVYALGCVLFEALTGQIPFPRDSDAAKMYAHMSSPPPRLTELVDVPVEFDAVIARALSKDPDERYQSAGDLGRAAQAAARGEVPEASETSVAIGAAAADPTTAATEVSLPAPAAEEPRGGLSDYVRGWWDNLRGGELGILPILVGIVVIGAYFQYRNSNFLTAGNFVNLIVQMSPFAIIGMGLVFVLLLGEIDLSVGYVSGMGGVIAAVLLNPDGNQTSTFVAVAAALGVGCTIGLIQGFFVAKIGVPSFVVTLAGLLGWNGVVLLIIGSQGTLVIQDKFINGLANDNMSPEFAWIVAIASVALYVGIQAATVFRRRKFDLPNPPWSIIVLKTAVIAALAFGVVGWANQDRGVPYVGLLMLGLLLFWTYIATRTRFGRHVYSVGGNAEASRRAGISVPGIKLAVFAISGTMAAIGGLVLASRLSSVDTNTGGGSVLLYSIAAAVIGGTSLFGGRGTVRSAVLGAIVIAMIDNGLGLINVSAGTKFVVTGIVLLAAVTLDSLSRRRIVASGRA